MKKIFIINILIFFVLIVLVDIFANTLKLRPLLWKNSFYSYLNNGWYTWSGADHLYENEIHSKQTNGFETRGLKPNKKINNNIILLGDSFLETSHKLSEMPERYLRDAISDSNIISFGSWGWGNNELQYYRQQNTSVENGYLTIMAKQEYYGGFNYTSSRIKTQGNIFHTYGRIDIRAKLPYGQGLWPALWMLGENFSSVGWPSCGEIDIMEMIGGNGWNDRTVHGTVHWEDNGHASYGGHNTLSSGKLADEFHVFSIIWTPSSIKWLRDDIQYHIIDINNLSAFHNNFFFIFNVAVGGNWPGSPDASTIFPQTMIVDYIRVFQ